MKSNYEVAYSEVLTILEKMDTRYQEKIPQKLIRFFEKHKRKDYNMEWHKNVPLRNQKINPETVTLLAMLDLYYWCETEEERSILRNKFVENERRYREAESQRYNQLFEMKNDLGENLFGAGNRDVHSADKIEQTLAIKELESKENLWQKIINKIKKIFKI